MWRHQLPAWSPVSLGAVARGLGGRSDPGVADRLSRSLAGELGADRVLLTASGTLALGLAIEAAGSRAAGRPVVALPAWGCFDLASAADGAGADVRLYDLDPRTLVPDGASVRRSLAAGVDAVVVVHLYGLPVGAADLAAEVRAAGATLIDDAAQGAGASIAGRPLGGAGDLGVLSFGRGKGRTGGRGGALLGFGDAGKTLIDGLDLDAWQSAPGRVTDAIGLAALWLLGRPSLYRIPASVPWLRLGETIYHPPPARAPIDRFAAGVLLAAAPAVEAENGRRRASGEWWSQALTGVSGLERVVPPAGAEPGWLRYPVVVRPDLVPAFASKGFRRLGVMPGYPKPLVELAGFGQRVRRESGDAWPGAQVLASRLFTLPTHGLVGRADRDRLLAAIRVATRRP